MATILPGTTGGRSVAIRDRRLLGPGRRAADERADVGLERMQRAVARDRGDRGAPSSWIRATFKLLLSSGGQIGLTT